MSECSARIRDVFYCLASFIDIDKLTLPLSIRHTIIDGLRSEFTLSDIGCGALYLQMFLIGKYKSTLTLVRETD